MWVFVGYCCCEENIRVVLGWLKGIGRLDGGILTEMEGGKLWKIFDGWRRKFWGRGRWINLRGNWSYSGIFCEKWL